MEIFGVPLRDSDIYLLGAVGVLLMALVYPRVNDWQHRRGRLRDAVYAYKSAFANCASAVANNSFSIDTFTNDFERHKDAVDAIRLLLPKCHQRKLQKAWNEYCGKNNDFGFDSKEYIQAFNALVYSTNKEMFDEFKTRFNVLHGCLDGLL